MQLNHDAGDVENHSFPFAGRTRSRDGRDEWTGRPGPAWFACGAGGGRPDSARDRGGPGTVVGRRRIRRGPPQRRQ